MNNVSPWRIRNVPSHQRGQRVDFKFCNKTLKSPRYEKGIAFK